MHKTRIVGIVLILLLLGVGLVGAMAVNGNNPQDAASQQESSEGLTNDEIRDGLINHGVNHKEGEN